MLPDANDSGVVRLPLRSRPQDVVDRSRRMPICWEIQVHPGRTSVAILRIVKRTGDIVPFDRGRIHGAVTKAIRAVGRARRVVPHPRHRRRRRRRRRGALRRGAADRRARPGPGREGARARGPLRGRQGLHPLPRRPAARARRAADGGGRARPPRPPHRPDPRRRHGALRHGAAAWPRSRRGSAISRPTSRSTRWSAEALRTIFDGMATTQIERALVLAAAAFIERDPAYSVAASRLQLDALFREVTQASPGDGDRDARYRDAFATGLRRGVGSGLYDARLAAFDHAALAAALRPERDALLQYLGVQTLADRYLARDDGRTVELPQASGCASRWGSPSTRTSRPAGRSAFYDLMSTLRYVPSTPTLFHAGTPRPQLSSCYLTTVQDDLAPHLQGARRQRPALEVVGRARQRLDQHPRHRRAHRQHPRREPGRGAVPQGRQRRHHGDQPQRQAPRRDLRLSRGLALRHRGLPRAAPQHRRRAPPHPRHEHGGLDPRPVHGAGRGRRAVDAVLAGRGARPARDLRPRLRRALPRGARRAPRAASCTCTAPSRRPRCGARC